MTDHQADSPASNDDKSQSTATETEISHSDWHARQRRGFISMGVFALATAAGLGWLFTREPQDGVPWPFRTWLGINQEVTQTLLKPTRLDVIKKTLPAGTVARVNGDIGLDDEIEESSWNLQVEVNTEGPVRAGAKNPAPLKISLAQFKTFRQSQTQAEFRCIEGWSQTLAYAGVTFADFLTQTGLGTKSGEPYRKETPRSDLYNYVALETPGGEYYVSVDIESMLHPQTLLASELNGAPLLPENGAPLRLIIPVKYGIKSLKRVGRIYFADERPADYWHERGYDWYSGL